MISQITPLIKVDGVDKTNDIPAWLNYSVTYNDLSLLENKHLLAAFNDTSIVCSISDTEIYCGVNGLHVAADRDGHVGANNGNGTYCNIGNDKWSACHYQTN